MVKFINGREFRQFRNTVYFVDEFGNVFSEYCNRFIKPLVRKRDFKDYYYIDVYNSELGRQQHVALHHIVWISWVGEIPEGYQINHINDCSSDNWLENLYIGTQKDNIYDCYINGHKCSSTYILKVYDKLYNKELTFCPSYNFINYCGHTFVNGSVKRFFNKIWFNERYEIIDYHRINNLAEYESVTTMGDECNPVE